MCVCTENSGSLSNLGVLTPENEITELSSSQRWITNLITQTPPILDLNGFFFVQQQWSVDVPFFFPRETLPLIEMSYALYYYSSSFPLNEFREI